MIHPALDASLVSCSHNSWDVLFCIASDAAKQAGICTRAGSNHFYQDGNDDFYDINIFDDPLGQLSGESFDPANCDTHYADYPAFRGVGDNDRLPNLQGVWSTTAGAATTSSSTGGDSASWGGVANAKQEDETWATIDPTSVDQDRTLLTAAAGTDYIVLSNYGFNIPLDATIVGVVAAMKGFSYYDIHATTPSGSLTEYGLLTTGGVFNAGLMLNGVLYPFADPSTHPLTSPASHASPPWPHDPGTFYASGTPIENGLWVQGNSLNWPRVVDPSWYTATGSSETTLIQPATPSQANAGIKPLIITLGVTGAGEGPLFSGNIVGCPVDVITSGVGGYFYTVSAHNGPIQKNTNLTPTKPTWTPAEINDPSFGAAISVWADLVNDVDASDGFTTIYQSHMFLNCIAIAVYYTTGTGGGTGATKRPRVWIST